MTHKPRLLVHTSRIPIRWGDMDALGHVNNTVYFRYMEQARIEWVAKIVPAAGGAHLLPIVIVNASCTFLRPLVYPGEVEVRLLLSEPGRTSVGSHYELRCGDELYAEGAAKIVWIEPGTGRPAPLPAVVSEPLRQASAGAVALR
jgi:acyl-CoA thioester hydrolase